MGEHVFELTERLLHHAAFYKEAGEITLQLEGENIVSLTPASVDGLLPLAGDLHAPMAGKIIRILVQPGEHVKAGATLLILEAMKMEQHITAPQDGVVASSAAKATRSPLAQNCGGGACCCGIVYL